MDTGPHKISVHSCSFVVSFASASAKIALHFMKEAEQENQHAPLSYHGAWRIVWLVFLLFIVWLILRALQPVILPVWSRSD